MAAPIAETGVGTGTGSAGSSFIKGTTKPHALTYTNPVWPGYFADPFVLRWQDESYAYGTGGSRDDATGRVFPMLHSKDFVNWEAIGGVLTPLADGSNDYWAPEVAARDGKFYLYYSAARGTGTDGAGDETHRLRVAVASHPAGPFTDSGHLLLPEGGFTIDAHPFQDPKDGQWYLFFARDFLDAHVGTALAIAPLSGDMLSLSGPATTALRPSGDWQIYERNRTMYGQKWEAWHTVEGAFVVPHEGRYWLLYSGGAHRTRGRAGCPARRAGPCGRTGPQLGRARPRRFGRVRRLPRLGHRSHRPASLHRPAHLDPRRPPLRRAALDGSRD